MNSLDIASGLPDRYYKMAQRINEIMPRIEESNKAFFKSDSQIKMVSLNITELTPISAAKHILARVERKREALVHSEISLRRKEVKLEKKKEKRRAAVGAKADLLDLDIISLTEKIESARNYQSGAVRELAFLIEQYDAICDDLGVDVITEDMYEKDQPRFHVMRAFSQALAAARSRQGLIDEGNFIYMQHLGINGAAAQKEVIAFMEEEQNLVDKGLIPSFELEYQWLQAIADKFEEQVRMYAEYRGFNSFVPSALATTELEGSK